MKGAAIEVGAASRLLLAEVSPTAAEMVPIERCLDRVTATAVLAPAPLPGFDNSAMDGYAVRSSDLARGPLPLRIVTESRAGFPAEVSLERGEAARISTGAKIPSGADAVVPLEEAREEGETVFPCAPTVLAGAHVRRAGEDLQPGAVALPAGVVLGPAELGMVAALGLAEIECHRRPRLGILTAGDELLEPGTPPAPGRIYDANRFTLQALASRAGAEAFHAGSMPDDLESTRSAIASALDADFLVLSGGVSVGRHDHVKEALAELGVEQLFWRVALRPGGPTWGGVLRRSAGPGTVVFGLPGNPVSAMVTFRLFVQPAVLAATGRDPASHTVRAVLGESCAQLPGRAQYLRCRFERQAGSLKAYRTPSGQASNLLTSMVQADGLAIIPAGEGVLEAGVEIEALLTQLVADRSFWRTG